MKDRDAVIAALSQPFPKHQIRERVIGGGRHASYLPGEVVIRRLNEATDNQWDFRVLDVSERPFGSNTLVIAKVSLNIVQLGEREHIGVQLVTGAGGEDLVKGAITDALKKAATLFGVALHLYGSDEPDLPGEEAPYNNMTAPLPKPQPRKKVEAGSAQKGGRPPINPEVEDEIKKRALQQVGIKWSELFPVEDEGEPILRKLLREAYGVASRKDMSLDDLRNFYRYLNNSTSTSIRVDTEFPIVEGATS